MYLIKKKIVFGLIFLGIMLFLVNNISSVAAANVDVGPGHTYSSISEGINAANSGDTIRVYDNFGSPYTYTENVMMTKNNLNIMGMGDVTIQGISNPDSPVVVGMSSDSVLKNFKIYGVGDYGVIISANCLVEENVISGNIFGIRGPGATNVQIKNNNIFNNENGIYLDSGDIGLISGNVIRGCDVGINAQGMDHLTIENNIIRDNQNMAIHSDGCKYENIFQNQIINNGAGIHIFSADDTPVHFNLISGNTLYGLENEQLSIIPLSQSNGIVYAEFNWWGYNSLANVQSQINNIGNGNVYFDPWMVLSIKTNPSTVTLKGTSTVTSDLLHDSNGVYHNPSQVLIPYNGPANFQTTKGTIADANFINGEATSTLKNLNTAGTAKVTSQVSNQLVRAYVTVKYQRVSIKEVTSAANSVRYYYTKHNALPSAVYVGINKLTMSEFLYLLVTATLNTNVRSITPILVNKPTKPNGSYNSGRIFRSEYLSVAKKIKTYITTYRRAPNYTRTSLGNIPFTKLVYMYSKILSFYKDYYALPSYVSI